MRAFALGEQRQGLARDIGFEVAAFHVRFQRRFVAEQFIEQKLRRVVLVAADQKELRAGIFLRLGEELIED